MRVWKKLYNNTKGWFGQVHVNDVPQNGSFDRTIFYNNEKTADHMIGLKNKIEIQRNKRRQ